MKGSLLKLGISGKGRWRFSGGLLIGYIVIFSLWLGADRSFVVASGVLWGLVFGLWLLVSWKRGYFVDRLDQLGHWAVVLDVILESLLIEHHEHYGFLICAMAFAGVLGGYRARAMMRVNDIETLRR